MQQLNDLTLVTRVIALHDKRAFDSLVVKYQSPVRRFFLNQTLGNKELSDDLAQETFLKAYTHLTAFRNLSNFSTWLYRIAYNVFYDYLRQQRPTAELLEETDTPADYSGESGPNVQMDLYTALGRLKEEERTCITLFYMEDLPLNKIAAITGMTVGTVKSHLFRGKHKLTDFLKQNGYGSTTR